jgi:hypothetical protein
VLKSGATIHYFLISRTGTWLQAKFRYKTLEYDERLAGNEDVHVQLVNARYLPVNWSKQSIKTQTRSNERKEETNDVAREDYESMLEGI